MLNIIVSGVKENIASMEELIQSIEEYKVKHPQGSLSISFSGFESKEEAETFTANFPKYVGLEARNSIIGWRARIEISSLNANTGEANELGTKRINRLLKGLEDLGLFKPVKGKMEAELEANRKAIQELHKEAGKDISKVLMLAIENELERRYRLDRQLEMATIIEKEKRN